MTIFPYRGPSLKPADENFDSRSLNKFLIKNYLNIFGPILKIWTIFLEKPRNNV